MRENRFYIDVTSEILVGDIEWAKVLLLLNKTLNDHGYGHIDAILRSYEN